MLFLLSKLVPAIFFPLPLAVWLGLSGAILAWRRRARRAALVAAVAALLLWSASMPVVAGLVAAPLERRYPVRAAAELPSADAIVVLAGGVHRVASLDAVEVSDGGDRVLFGARLHRAGKAPLVVVSGGRVPWLAPENRESAAMAELLAELGVPRDAIVEEAESRNTRENAVRTAELLEARRIRRILLVTSALHMPRAMAEFEAAGLTPLAAPCDVHTSGPSWSTNPFDWLPHPSALGFTSYALKEHLGLAARRLRRD